MSGAEASHEVAAGSGDRERARQPKFFVHVPKTAGTSLFVMLRSNEPRPILRLGNVFKGSGGAITIPPEYERMGAAVDGAGSVGLVTGHIPLGTALALPSQWRPQYLTFVRDPVERAISHYFQILGARRDGSEGAEPGNNSESLDDEADVAVGPNDVVQPEEPASRRMEPLRDDMPYETVLRDLHYVPDNLHTRMLCDDPEPFGEVTRAMLEQAKNNLEHQLVFLGLVERYDESVVLLRHRLGCRGILTPIVRTSATRPRGGAVPTELIEAARGANRLDIELYEFAQELFERAPEHRTLEFQIDLAALRQARADDSGEGVDQQPPPPDYPGDPVGWSMLLRARVDALRFETDFVKTRRRLLNAHMKVEEASSALAAQEEAVNRMRARNAGLSRRLQRHRAGTKRPVADPPPPRKKRPKRAR